VKGLLLAWSRYRAKSKLGMLLMVHLLLPLLSSHVLASDQVRHLVDNKRALTYVMEGNEVEKNAKQSIDGTEMKCEQVQLAANMEQSSLHGATPCVTDSSGSESIKWI
jgi:hypothetical protein